MDSAHWSAKQTATGFSASSFDPSSACKTRPRVAGIVQSQAVCGVGWKCLLNVHPILYQDR